MKNKPTLNSHKHCQAAQTSRTSQSLSISVSEPTHRQKKESTIAQQCIRAIAGEVVKSRSVHLINFCGGGQVIALKSATALILDRYQ
jgi:phosphoserine aminotransferase